MSDPRFLARRPQCDPTAWIAPGVTLLGDVTIGARSSVWYGSVVRGDADQIVVGADTNIQDLSVVHVDDGVPCRIGDRVGIGHRAIIHGCTIGDDVLIGMGAIILNGAVIESGAVVGAGAVVLEGRVIPAGMLALGTPAQAVRPVDEALAARQRGTWQHYVEQATRHREMWKTNGGG